MKRQLIIISKYSSLVLAFISLFVQYVLPMNGYAGKQIYVTTEKAIYPYPLEDEIQIMGYLREVPAGTPVDIEISLELPDGNETWLNPDMEFQPSQYVILEQFPFVSVPAAELFKTDGSKILKPNGDAMGDMMAGRYVLKSELSGEGVTDTSESVFFLAPEELIPSIADTPRPIIDSVDPPWGGPGEIITINGRNLRGMEELVEPELIDKFQIKVTLAGQEIPITDMDTMGQWLKVRLPLAPLAGDIIVNLTLPYWDLLEPDDTLLIPRVASYPSNAFPFWVEPVITGVDSANIAPGSSVVFYGRNFSETVADNQLLFDEIPGTITAATADSLTVTVPQISTALPVAVEPVSNGIKGDPFYIYIASHSILNWYPRTLNGGENLTITGSGFSSTLEENAVFVDEVPLYISSATETKLIAVTSVGLKPGIHPLEVVVRGVSVKIDSAITVVPSW